MFLTNKNQVRCFVASFLLSLVFLLTPFSVSAQTVTNDAQYRAVLFELIETLQAQIAFLQEQLAAKKINESQTRVRPPTVSDGVSVLNRYEIAKESDAKNSMNLEHLQYLKRVYEVFPDEYDDKLREFIVFEEAGGDFGAFVETIPPDHENWSFAISADLLGREKTVSNTELIVHELAHIISYESIAEVPLPSNASCHEYFKTRGCPKDNSYLSVFVDEFWSVSDLGRALTLRITPDAIDRVDEYFESNEDQYVSGYAALSPEEDFAESFAQYVMARGPQTNTAASKKVWWFDQHTQLQDIRRYIR